MIGLFIDVVFVSRGVPFVIFVRVRVGRLLHKLLHEIDVICFCFWIFFVYSVSVFDFSPQIRS